MTEQGESVEQALLAHADRQTKALENINALFKLFLVVCLIAAVVVFLSAID